MIGHNGYSFDDVVAENLERGLLLAQRDCAVRALNDPNLSQRHRVVLAQLIYMTNNETGVSFPGRKYLAETTGYTEAGVAKTISELVDMGYVVSTRRVPETGKRPLAHYAIVKPSVEELRASIDAHIASLRAGVSTGNVTPIRNVTWRNYVTPVGNVTSPGNVTPVGNVSNATLENIVANQCAVSDVTPVGNVTPVVPTVTSINTNLELLSEKITTIGDPKPKRGTRLADDWFLPKPWGEWAMAHYSVTKTEVRELAADFHDYWVSRADQGASKRNWEATWRNNCRKVLRRKRRDGVSTGQEQFEIETAADGDATVENIAYERERQRIRAEADAARRARLGDG